MAPSPPKTDQALALLAAGKLAQARSLITRAIQASPADPAPVDAMRALCIAEGNLKQAHYFATRALALAPHHPTCLANLAALDSALGDFPLAISRARTALALEPPNAQAHAALLGALLTTGRYADALAAATTATAHFPNHRDFAIKHAAALLHLGLADEAVPILSKAQIADPDDRELAEMLCTVSNYASAQVVSPARSFAIHRAFGRLADAAPVAPLRRPAARPPDRPGAGSRLRIGFISPDFRAHSVATFALPLISRLTQPAHALDVFCYNTSPPSRADATTQAFRHAVTPGRFRESARLGSVALAEQIAADDLHILIDLAGLTQGHRLDALRHRPAPVQVTYLGYPSTTGCGFIDARLVDALSDPPTHPPTYPPNHPPAPPNSATSPQHASAVTIPVESLPSRSTERLDRPWPCFLCLGPPDPATLPPVSRSARKTTDEIVFGSFNALTKVTGAVLAAWARFLSATPGSRLIIKASELTSPDVQDFTRQRAQNAGIDPARLELRGRAASTAHHLAAYADIDIALDTFPYNGATTTCEALLMGVPVLTPPGDRHAARVGASILHAVGAPQWVISSQAHLPETLKILAASHAEAVSARQSLRNRVLRSPLCDADSFADTFAAWARATAARA